MNERHFAIRTIVDGRVRIGRRWYVPPRRFLVYDGRLDGMRFAFGRYRDYANGGYSPYVHLYGTEAYFRDANAPWPGPEVVDGYFPWDIWEEEQ